MKVFLKILKKCTQSDQSHQDCMMLLKKKNVFIKFIEYANNIEFIIKVVKNFNEK